MNKDIDIVVIFNSIPYSITIDKSGLISQVIEAIFESFNLNSKIYEILFQKKPLKITDNRPLISLIGNKNNSVFTINKKTILSSVGKELINGNNKLKKKANNENLISSNYQYSLLLSNSNLNEVKNLISNFNNLKKSNQAKILSNENNKVKITFNSNENKNEFINYYNSIKQNNKNSKKLDFTKINHNKNFSVNQNILTSERKKRKNKNFTLSYDFSSQQPLTPRNFSKNFSFGELDPFISSESSKIINNFYSHQKFVRNSSPYITEDEKRKYEEKENKKKFLNKKGFFVSVGKYSMKPNYIGNYVQMTPSESPLNFKFRVDNKNKWLTKKGFINA